MNKKDMVKLLNEDLTKEYAAAVQYIQHAAAITGAQYQAVQKELIIHSGEEMAHALSLADQIATLGGEPTVEVNERFVSKDSKKMLKQDLAGEEDAIMRYKARVAQAAEMGEHGLKRALEDILIVEEEHRRDIQFALGM
jgi:bacterioferritin